ncbi:efflux RND transporter periplasmic adaptor subunit [Falsirhodobacter sp. 20TX0035]|uniref:efflux RND transporter periplasmic adaptor subunit n=1 Tax=Falsirhodobacter sp. 20TX0035 TaxID=3022019 RepID=UPI00232CABBD|nr:efflux RND transporter periplasmic adaptor subunit [Falsirhodobacter sp. 20TX0035]MDB6452793.1 efflux RND transporter periplasmic adaptor subunit [Falsirhodobacter sp. 20TX0035]
MKRLCIAVLAALIPVQAALAQAQGGGEMPPTPVSFVQVQPEALPVINDLPGRISATRIAEVRPRVGGIVVERVFEQGSLVNAGDVLYRLDPAQYRVQVASAEGTLARAQAAQKNAQSEATRQQELRERNASSGSTYDTAVSALAQADADIAIAQAQLQQAQLDLDYTEVRAPITGVIGRATITEGALVAAQTDVLATIQQLDPIYADFTQSTSQVLALRRQMAEGQLAAAAPGEAKVSIFYDDGTRYEHPGKLLFSEATVDETTGQVTLRAEVPNPEGYLLPGLYVRVQIEQAVRNDALAVPQMAVQRAQDGSTSVFVIGEDNSVQPRPVTLGSVIDGRWVVNEGLNPGDRVVVAGAQKLQPGMAVQPEPWQPNADPNAQGDTAQGEQPAN